MNVAMFFLYLLQSVQVAPHRPMLHSIQQRSLALFALFIFGFYLVKQMKTLFGRIYTSVSYFILFICYNILSVCILGIQKRNVECVMRQMDLFVQASRALRYVSCIAINAKKVTNQRANERELNV